MHMGNLMSALVSWLSVRSRGGRWILRIEDLDPQRSRLEYARQIEDDLQWLGLDWDEGGLDEVGLHGPYRQSLRGDLYHTALERLASERFIYPCRCRRADIMATQAPHQSDGRIVYAGTCRPDGMPESEAPVADLTQPAAMRLYVPDEDIVFTDRVYGTKTVNLASHCGDFVVRRADGAWAYQLAVVVDDGMMDVTEVVRGCDLLLSSAQQIYLYRLLGYPVPEFAHVPLLCNSAGRRLSKRDASMSAGELRRRYAPEQLTARLARLAGIIPDGIEACSSSELIPVFEWANIPVSETIILTDK